MLQGLLTGILLSCFMYQAAVRIGQLPTYVALCVSISLPCVSVVANAVGALLPLMCVRFKLDPAVTAAPMMTTLVDAAGIATFMSVSGVLALLTDHKGPRKHVNCTTGIELEDDDAGDSENFNLAVDAVMDTLLAIVLVASFCSILHGRRAAAQPAPTRSPRLEAEPAHQTAPDTEAAQETPSADASVFMPYGVRPKGDMDRSPLQLLLRVNGAPAQDSILLRRAVFGHMDECSIRARAVMADPPCADAPCVQFRLTCPCSAHPTPRKRKERHTEPRCICYTV